MTAQAFNIAMVFRADVSNAKAGLSDVTGSLRNVSAEVQNTNAATSRQAAELERMANAAAKAAMSQNDLAASERRAAETRMQAQGRPLNVLATPVVGQSAGFFRTTETAASSLQGTITGLNATIGTQAHDMIGAAQSSRAWREALDDVRASFNPLFAASRQYEQQLLRIAEAEELGALNAGEAAMARQRAASIIAPVSAGAAGRTAGQGPQSYVTGNLAAQGNDIFMMAAAGQNPMMLALQQGTQVSQVLNQLDGKTSVLRALSAGFMSMVNPVSLATIGIIGLGAAGVQWLGSLRTQVKSADEALADLATGIDRLAKANENAGMSSTSLAARFGSASEEGRKLLQTISEIERRGVSGDAKSSIDSVFNDLTGGSAFGLRSQSDRFGALQRMFGEANFLTSGRRSETASPNSFGVEQAFQGLLDSRESGNIDDMIAAAVSLRESFEAAQGAFGGITDQENNALKTITELEGKLRDIKALDDNSAGKAQADEMTRQLRGQIELQRVALRFGQDSVEYRAAENRQARENLVLELEGLGLKRDSDTVLKALGEQARIALLREDQANKAREDAQRGYLTGMDDQIAANRRELSLLGASQTERARANALAEVEVEIRKRGLSLREAEEVRAKAIAKADSDAALARGRTDQELMLGRLSDGFDRQIGLARDPVSQADLESQKEYARILATTGDAEKAAGEAARIRARAINEAIGAARVQAADLADEVSVRQRIADQVAAGLIPAGEANRLIREELELRPLVVAAARAEGEEKRSLLDVITNLRIAQEAMAAEDRRQTQNDYLRGQAERIQQARLELALVGETAAVRARVLTMVRAEQDIRRLGINGDAAEEVRKQARIEGDLAQTIEAQADAWKRVQSAGENAIDGILDKLKDGDVAGAFEDLASEIGKGFFDLAVRNPLKNKLFGTNLGTINDVGGLGGIMDRLAGRAPVDEAGLIGLGAAPVQSMTITAAQVILNGNMAGLPGLTGPAANLNAAPGTLPGSGNVQSQVWSYFAGKGLAPHQIAAVMGNVAGESSFNPLAVGDNGTSFGLFQHHAGRGQGLLNATGGMAGLGNVQAQLDYVWQELLTSEQGVLKRLLGSADVRGATEAFVGFERPQGWSAANPSGAHNFDGRLAAAETALSTFSQSTMTATTDLGSLGKGFDIFGSALSGLASGGPEGALSGLLGGLGTAFAGALGIPGFASGGRHKGGLRVVGENGPELEYTGPSTILPNDLTEKILTARGPSLPSGSASPVVFSPRVEIVNQSSAPVVGEMQESTDERGQRQYALVVSDAVGQGLAKPGGRAARSMRDIYGVSRSTRRRNG